MCRFRPDFAVALDCAAMRAGESAPGQTGGTARTPCSWGLLDRWHYNSVLAEIEALGLDMQRVLGPDHPHALATQAGSGLDHPDS